MSLPHVYRVTKYDPADRAPNGTYQGTQDSDSDRGPVEAAYLAAVGAFAEESGAGLLTVRDPQISGPALFGREPLVEGYGLAGLFPDGLDGFHDGAPVPVPLALELVRGMLRGGAWCRLEAEGLMTVHVGWDQYVYVGVRTPCETAVARTRELGLFPEPIGASPYEPSTDDAYELRPADEEFWERVRASAARGEAGLVEESPAANASRWYAIGDGSRLDAIRAGLAPRALLNVWPGLSADTAGLLAGLPEEFTVECVWEDADGRISSGVVDEEERAELARVLAGARAAALLSIYADERKSLFTGVLPDADGVVRARWQL
ncbi:RNA-binding protein [Streptomyces sp. NPDC002812]|uniref:RNA-binding protein n=1 Tax=Streptomyces sp. NPDC002812 TaxID=3154434 RepID=UPI003318179E